MLGGGASNVQLVQALSAPSAHRRSFHRSGIAPAGTRVGRAQRWHMQSVALAGHHLGRPHQLSRPAQRAAKPPLLRSACVQSSQMYLLRWACVPRCTSFGRPAYRPTLRQLSSGKKVRQGGGDGRAHRCPRYRLPLDDTFTAVDETHQHTESKESSALCCSTATEFIVRPSGSVGRILPSSTGRARVWDARQERKIKRERETMTLREGGNERFFRKRNRTTGVSAASTGRFFHLA